MPEHGWQYMQDGVLFGSFNRQGGPRGDKEFVAPNWYMGIAMRKAGNGSIVNISASSSKTALPERPAYHASKGAINAMTRQMAVDYGTENIRANTIIDGFIFTGTP